MGLDISGGSGSGGGGGGGGATDGGVTILDSGSPIDLGSTTTRFIKITGSSSISSFGTSTEGQERVIEFTDGNLYVSSGGSIQIQATNVITENGLFPMNAGDVAYAVGLAGNLWKITSIVMAGGGSFMGQAPYPKALNDLSDPTTTISPFTLYGGLSVAGAFSPMGFVLNMRSPSATERSNGYYGNYGPAGFMILYPGAAIASQGGNIADPVNGDDGFFIPPVVNIDCDIIPVTTPYIDPIHGTTVGHIENLNGNEHSLYLWAVNPLSNNIQLLSGFAFINSTCGLLGIVFQNLSENNIGGTLLAGGLSLTGSKFSVLRVANYTVLDATIDDIIIAAATTCTANEGGLNGEGTILTVDNTAPTRTHASDAAMANLISSGWTIVNINEPA